MRRRLRFGRRCFAGNVQRGEFVLAELNLVALVENGRIKTGLAVAVAMKIAETDVARIGNFHGPRKRLKRMNDAVAVEIRERDVAGRIYFNRQTQAAFAPFFFSLQGIKAPMRCLSHFDFIVDMMLAGNLISAARRFRIGYKHSRMGKGRGRPEVKKRPAAAVSDPKAWILAVPVPIWIWIGGVIDVVRIFARTVWQRR